MAENKYPNLITSEHSDKAKFMAMVGVTTEAFAGLVDLVAATPVAYDVATAIGAQLDMVGQWVGAPRNLTAPLTGVYFAFDTSNVGFDQGVWKGPYDPDTGLVTLPDDLYRLVILARILNNNWDGSRDQLYALADVVFAPFGLTYFVEDNADLTIIIGLLGSVPPSAVMTALFASGVLDIKPITIYVNARVVQQGPIFTFDADTLLFKGFDLSFWAVSA